MKEAPPGIRGDRAQGGTKEAKLETAEGARLYESLVIGRQFADVPTIVARICGICPVVHTLTSLKAIENAFGIKVNQQVIILRKILELAQIVHSHSLHLFFLSLPDFFDIKNDLDLVKKFPQESSAVLEIRRFATEVVRVIGGRTVHILTAEVGGFKILPDKSELKKLMGNYDKIFDQALSLVELFRGLSYPRFIRQTEFISLTAACEYAIYEGDLKSHTGWRVKSDKFREKLSEIEKPYERVKQSFLANTGDSFMVGALARINNNYPYLSFQAKKIWDSLGADLPDYNSFHNIFAQMVEVIHCLEQLKILITEFLDASQINLKTDFKVRAGQGVGAVEAPRGTLYHAYEINNQGIITKCDIITPTAQLLNNLEDDLKQYLGEIKSEASVIIKNKIRTLIRAYDPCISCATH